MKKKNELNESKKIKKVIESTNIKLTEGYFEDSMAQMVKEATEVKATFDRMSSECNQAIREFKSSKTPADFGIGLKTITDELDKFLTWGVGNLKRQHDRFVGDLKFTTDKGYEKFWQSKV
jgi:hypothetical protein